MKGRFSADQALSTQEARVRYLEPVPEVVRNRTSAQWYQRCRTVVCRLAFPLQIWTADTSIA